MSVDLHRADLVEILEPRRLFAAAPLNIVGTAAKDLIVVATTATTLTVTVNGVPQVHNRADVSALNISCGGGDDLVVGTGATLGFYIDGGDGNDKLLGGDGPDTILGASGKDQIDGGGGNDRLNGSGGNDKIAGGLGADRLYGGDGNDFMDGASSNDKFYGGAGMDSMYGDGGKDSFYAIDKTIDIVYGGSGIDTALSEPQDIRGSIEHVALV
jgi:Ca2+-binding RTX toxin-like protein